MFLSFVFACVRKASRTREHGVDGRHAVVFLDGPGCWLVDLGGGVKVEDWNSRLLWQAMGSRLRSVREVDSFVT
jgi:hypothetical protein